MSAYEQDTELAELCIDLVGSRDLSEKGFKAIFGKDTVQYMIDHKCIVCGLFECVCDAKYDIYRDSLRGE